ncbi:MAG TPA: hypothetical protein VE987_18835 [Polyangiaceae bacterium]|nr:hypothetical protein [Polyangiaceae bacterium]
MRAGRCAASALAALALVTSACDRGMLVGADPTACADAGGDGPLTTLAVPWSTGFENQFNDFTAAGLCYFLGGASFAWVSPPSPVHSGQHAASFTVNTSLSNLSQARCKLTGVLPTAAYYSAWYYIAAAATNQGTAAPTNQGNWNLLHFQGSNGPGSGCVFELWDVSLVNAPDGGLLAAAYDFERNRPVLTASPVPINRWFRLEVYLRRAVDATGRFALYVDENPTPAIDLQGLVTDSSAWGEWHVGNLATALSPPMSTVYVDDVAIDTNGP